jgi:uncharacterized protein
MIPIDVFAMARTGAERAGELPLAQLPRLAAGLARAEGSLQYRARGFTDGLGRPSLRLQLRAQLPLRCDRCGRETVFDLQAERVFYFVATEAELAAIEVDAAPEEALVGATGFDLAGLAEDEAILQLPLSPRHEQCEAASRGANPEAAAAPRPNPFAQLAGLREQLRAGAAPATDEPVGKVAPDRTAAAKAKRSRRAG